MTIGQRIKKVLDNQGMTQKELAEKSGITEVAISRYVHDKRIPQTLVLIDICDTLHVSSDYLLGIRYWGLKEKENEANGMTNGEKFKEMFSVTQVDNCDSNVYAWLPNHDAIEIPLEWWNAPYKAESEDKE